MRSLIILSRNDLIKLKEHANVKDINLEDFRAASMTTEEAEQADTIMFIDTNGEHKTLKSRYV